MLEFCQVHKLDKYINICITSKNLRKQKTANNKKVQPTANWVLTTKEFSAANAGQIATNSPSWLPLTFFSRSNRSLIRKSSAALLQSSIETQWRQNNFLRMHSYLVMILTGCEKNLANEKTLWRWGNHSLSLHYSAQTWTSCWQKFTVEKQARSWFSPFRRSSWWY